MATSGEKLPDRFDVVICGTGLVESMVAAAVARIDKKVLHIDRNDYYGSQWATFNYSAIIENLQAVSTTKEHKHETASTDNEILIPDVDSDICNVVIESNIPEFVEIPDEQDKEVNCEQDKIQNVKDDEEAKNSDIKVTKTKPLNKSIVSQAKIQQNSSDVSLEDFQILSRKFNLDLSVKFLFSAGPLVQSIIKANISHYMEFKLVNKILTIKDGNIIEVPCNRSDVFTSNFLSMIEKRMLMKFLNFCLENVDFEAEEMKPYAEKPFIEFLQSRRLSDNLQKFIIYSIAMVKPSTSTKESITKTQSFIQSLGRYGKSPFLWPLFGVGEIPQAFCRMCAVFGGLYCLRKELKSITVDADTGKCSTIHLDEETINSDFLVVNSNYIPESLKCKDSFTYVSRAILITNHSISPSDEEGISFLTIPPSEGKNEIVRVVEVGPASSASPTGLFVVYLTCQSTSTAKEDLQEYVLELVSGDQSDESKPFCLWSLYFNQLDSVSYNNQPENLLITSPPGSALGFEDAVKEAEAMFYKICPEGEFMLTVPNPEDIKWDHSESQQEEESTG